MKTRRPDGYKLIFSPDALHRLSAGFDQLADLMAVTLGPTQGPIVNDREVGSVELLSDSATIARRIIEVPNRAHNTGAMLLRNLVWNVHEHQGDGAATAAVIARAIVRGAQRRIEAGIDPVLIRDGIECALSAALPALEAQATPAPDLDTLSKVATALTGDAELGAVLGEMFDFLGPNAAMTIEELQRPFLDREYVEGGYWRAHPAIRSMIPEGQAEVVLENPLIMAVDQELDTIDQVQPALELAIKSATEQPLLIIPVRLGEEAEQLVALNHGHGTLNVVVAILSSVGQSHTDDLEDIALLTGGEVLADMIGRSPRRVQPQYLGTARRAVISPDSLIIVGGSGDMQAVQDKLAELHRIAADTPLDDENWEKLRKRMSRLGGGIGVLRIGSFSEVELKDKREQAEKAFRVLAGVQEEGLVPGGGVAYLQCLPAVRQARDSQPTLERAVGVDVFAEALKSPFEQIVRNHGGVHPPVALTEVERLGPNQGFDALTGEYVDVRERGILDSLRVARGVLHAATSIAVSALTTDAIVLPPESRRDVQVTP